MPATPRIEAYAGGAVIALAGELDAYDAPSLRESFPELLESEPDIIVLDLSGVAFLDSTVLGAIVGLLRRVREGGGELRTVLPDTTALRIFEIRGSSQRSTSGRAARPPWPVLDRRVWRDGARRRGALEVVMQGRREPAY